MAVVLNVTQPVYPVAKEDSSVTASQETWQPSSPCVNDYIVCDGPDDVEFVVTLTHPYRTETTTFTLKQGEINDVPFAFQKIQYSTTGSSSAFRAFAHKQQ